MPCQQMLRTDKKQKILDIPNRLFIAITGSIFCVFVEILLNGAAALTWDYAWWNTGAPWLILLAGVLQWI